MSKTTTHPMKGETMITIAEFEAAKIQRDEANRIIQQFVEQTELLPTIEGNQ